MTMSRSDVEKAFEESGERERVKELLSTMLRESGWTKEVRLLCRQVIEERGIDNVTLEDIFSNVKGNARKMVPDEVKRQVLQAVRQFVVNKVGIHDL